MKNTASKKKTCLGFLLIVFLAYVVCYLLSQTVFHEIYLFEWTAAHYYLCVWVASVIGKVWQLKTHYGVLIWLLVFLLSFIIGMLVEKKNHC